MAPCFLRVGVTLLFSPAQKHTHTTCVVVLKVWKRWDYSDAPGPSQHRGLLRSEVTTTEVKGKQRKNRKVQHFVWGIGWSWAEHQMGYCWWFRNPAPVEVGSWNPTIYDGFVLHPTGGCLGFLNHQQYFHCIFLFLGGERGKQFFSSNEQFCDMFELWQMEKQFQGVEFQDGWS